MNLRNEVDSFNVNICTVCERILNETLAFQNIRYYDQFKPEFYAKLQANQVAAQMAGNMQASVYLEGAIRQKQAEYLSHLFTFSLSCSTPILVISIYL